MKLLLNLIASIALTAGAFAQSYTVAIPPNASWAFGQTITIPAYDPLLDPTGAGVLTDVTTTITITVTQSYSAVNLADDALGQVVFNPVLLSGPSFTSCEVGNPIAGRLASKRLILNPQVLNLSPFGQSGNSATGTNKQTGFSITTTTVNPSNFTGTNGIVTLPVSFTGAYATQHLSGVCTASIRTFVSASITIKYN